jgi:ABC-type bacteriocin/lantibiotic exporter with double-glycine peptidase domain
MLGGQIACLVALSCANPGGETAIAVEPKANHSVGALKRSQNSTLDGRYDMICGPRCVQYLLQYYDRDSEDLIALVHEIQWPEIEAGASLESIETALRKRGVNTFAMQIGPEARLTWRFPVLLHLAEEGRSQGHYVVWLPTSSSRTVDVWCGLRGIERRGERDVATHRSGAILLTAPRVITDPDSAVSDVRWPSGIVWGLLVVLVGVVLTLIWMQTRGCQDVVR